MVNVEWNGQSGEGTRGETDKFPKKNKYTKSSKYTPNYSYPAVLLPEKFQVRKKVRKNHQYYVTWR